MSLRFDGLTVLVTGAGGGLGRAHAVLLAQLGASVVVNDVGAEIDGRGTSLAPAHQTCEMIAQAGGHAVADTSDIASPEGADALVATALQSFGRLDVVVNNAGIDSDEAFEEISWESFRRCWEVNAGGSFLVTQAAWPHLVASGHGRVVMTGSGTGMFGAVRRAHYASAKGAVFALMRALALEGEAVGIRVNGLAPVAYTRLAEAYAPVEARLRMSEGMPPEVVSPLVAWLSHSSCPVTGRMFTAGGGRIAEIFTAETAGDRPTPLSLEEIGNRLSEITDPEGAFVPRDSGTAVAEGLTLA